MVTNFFRYIRLNNFVYVSVGVLSLILYFYVFGTCIDTECSSFVLPYNTPDHYVYAQVIENYDDLEWWAPFLSNHGIAVLYFYFFSILGATKGDFVSITFFVNAFIYILCAISYLQLCDKLSISAHKSILFILYPPFLFFSVLINKDIVLTLLILRLGISLVNGGFIPLVFLTIGFAVVRTQYMVLPFISFFLMRGRFWPRVLLLYFITSIGAGLIARFTSVFEFDFAEPGLTTFIYEVNKRYGIGSLIFNPIRVFQYVIGFAQGWLIFSKDDYIDIMKLIEGVTFFWFLLVIPGVLKFFVYSNMNEIANKYRVVGSIILGFIFLMLMTAITEARYIVPIYPLLLVASIIKNRHPKIGGNICDIR